MSRNKLSYAIALAGAVLGNHAILPQVDQMESVDGQFRKIGKSSKHTVKFSGVLKARRIAKTRKNIRKHASKRKY